MRVCLCPALYPGGQSHPSTAVARSWPVFLPTAQSRDTSEILYMGGAGREGGRSWTDVCTVQQVKGAAQQSWARDKF